MSVQQGAEAAEYRGQVERESRRRRRNRIGILRRLTAWLRPLPDFVIVGVQKCGTTALHAYLLEHPDVVPARTKEIHFFDRNHARGPGWYRGHFTPSFSRRPGTLTGEASPSYFVHPLAPARIAATIPQARLIVLFRDPVERAYSHYQHNVRRGRERMTFEEAVACERRRIDGRVEDVLDSLEYFDANFQFSYLLRGIYAAQLERWHRAIPREQLLVLSNDALLREPEPTFAAVLDFLGLPAFRPEFQIHHSFQYGDMAEGTRHELEDFFRPWNEALFERLGRRFEWTRG